MREQVYAGEEQLVHFSKSLAHTPKQAICLPRVTAALWLLTDSKPHYSNPVPPSSSYLTSVSNLLRHKALPQ